MTEEPLVFYSMKPNAVIVAASGYFNPLHVGHIEYLNKAKALGDILVVIVNNDNQVKIKGAKQFMTEQDRLTIVRNLACVDHAILSVDQDASVCKTIELIGPNIFAKGGDRNIGNIPEADICNKLGVQIVDQLGAKIRASSDLLKNS